MAPLTLVLARALLRAARGRQLAVVAALGLATIIPVVVGASAAVTANAVLERTLAMLPVGERTVIVSYNGLLGASESANIDRTVRQRLSVLGAGPVRRQLEYRELADNAGSTFVLAAADGLPGRVRLVDGRMPRSCTPQRCEVVAEQPAGVADPVLRRGYGLAIVGHVVRTDPLLLSGTFAPKSHIPLLLADGVQRVASVEPLALIQRSYGWVAPLEAAAVSAIGVDAWSHDAAGVADRLFLDLTGLELVTPDAALRAESERADDSAGRFGLLAGSCAVLLLGAALAGGAALRPDHARFVSALRRRGLSAGRTRAVLALETLALAFAGAVAGLAAGFGVAAVMAVRASLPAWPTAGSAVAGSLPGVLVLMAAAWALLMISLWPSTSRPSYLEQRTAWRVLAAAALTGLIAVPLVISRGGPQTASAAGDPLVVMLPALILLTIGLATARLWPWAVRWAYRVLPRRTPGLRLGIAGISARPMLAAATVALLAAGVGATGFAASYRSTLLRGAQDQAAFEVPFDVRVQPGNALAPVLSLASVAQFADVAPGTQAMPVVRQAASIRSGPKAAEVVQMLGVDPAGLTRIHRWSRVIGGPGPAEVARALAVPPPDPGVKLPAGGRMLLRIGDELPGVVLAATIRASDGSVRGLDLTVQPARGQGPPGTGRVLGAELPAVPTGTDGWHLIAVSVKQSLDDATRREHGAGEGTTDRGFPAGRIVLNGVSVDDQPVAAPWSGWKGAGLNVGASGASAVLDFRLTSSVEVLSPIGAPLGSGASGQPLPVAADPLTAGQGPLLTLTLNGAAVRARVVSTLPRMSTVTGRFVVSDRRALTALIDASNPGQGQPAELWLALARASDQPQARKALAATPFTGLTVRWSTQIEHSLRTDPVARGAVQLLVLAAALTMLVALAALVLLVVSERFEDAGELYAWEADGVAPAVLRRGLWVRAALVAVVGVPAGVLGGLVLTRLTARLVGLTAGAQQPQPPLVAVTGAGTALSAIVLALAVALVAAGLVASAALREPQPVLPSPSRGGAG